MRRASLVLGVVALARVSAGAPLHRFFIEGDGRLAIANAHTGERISVRYRRDDGSYDDPALARIARVFRSSGDGALHDVSLRLIEVLSHVQYVAGVERLVLLSGYRSPGYNETLQGAARASLHTEGLAADLAFPASRVPLETLWRRVRALECCGVGYYAKDGYLHIDAGRPRFWEATTSRVDENLSGGNARVFARTEFDLYAAGEPVRIRVHAVTAPPLRLARAARIGDVPVRLEGDGDDCIAVAATGASVRIAAAPAVRDGERLVLETCAPRVERTPETIETNPVAIH
jgi:uncharacterized protein YcbK (DUF882 family)